ncbi:hypothetical protein X953_07495 [Virgibacillus sp. SK37]|nr:hypothetical protein X953_07495 [Virgibacillus sp. SK37]
MSLMKAFVRTDAGSDEVKIAQVPVPKYPQKKF